MKIPNFSLKSIVVLVLLLGAGSAMLMLGSHTVPSENRDFFNIGLGGWLAWTAMAVKRVLDGSDASDQKNDTIAAQAQTIAAQVASPEPPVSAKKP